jgi:hypothetical protein
VSGAELSTTLFSGIRISRSYPFKEGPSIAIKAGRELPDILARDGFYLSSAWGGTLAHGVVSQ